MSIIDIPFDPICGVCRRSMSQVMMPDCDVCATQGMAASAGHVRCVHYGCSPVVLCVRYEVVITDAAQGDPARSSCVQVTGDGPAEVLLRDFKAG
jgi:hypothetical protein